MMGGSRDIMKRKAEYSRVWSLDHRSATADRTTREKNIEQDSNEKTTWTFSTVASSLREERGGGRKEGRREINRRPGKEPLRMARPGRSQVSGRRLKDLNWRE